MAIFCIPKHLVAELKSQALKGQVDIKKLYEMSSSERNAFFSKYTGQELGKFINTEFEKAMISKQKSALTDWAKSVFTPKAQAKPVYKTVLDKINTLDELGVLNPKTEKAFLQDLVADRLGVNVSPEEVAIISEKASKIAEAQKKLGVDLGNPAKAEENIAFFKAKREMDDYLSSLMPASKLKVATGTIGRGMMLFSVKSPILNIGSNLEVGFTEAFSRRLASGQYRGTDGDMAKSFVKMANKIYKETGYDISRMTHLRDTGVSGERVLGSDTVHSEGPGATRRVGRVVEDIVFKNLMGAPDAAFASVHFADSVNTNSLKMAKGDSALAKQYMSDAMRLEPQTPQGEVLRGQAILDAQVATWTNDTWASKVSMGVRKILNDVTGDARLGDYVLPFVKTPANVIATGMDYAGLGIPKALVKTYKAVKAGNLATPEFKQSISRDLVRSGLGLVGALVITSQLSDDDFIGAYDPTRSQIEQLKNSNYNAVRIGGKWVSTDWLGPLMIPVSAMMYARKYANKPAESVFQFAKGVGSSVMQLPGVEDAADYFRENSYKKNQSLGEMTDEAMDYAVSNLYSRLIPSFVSDIAKVVDPYKRQTSGGLEAAQARLPVVSKDLPIKRNIFGEPIKNESAFITLLFGARVKTGTNEPVINEIDRLTKATDKGISFTDWTKTSSKTLAQFKEKVGGVKYDEAKLKYGAELKKLLTQTINHSSYKRLTDDEKRRVISEKDTEAMNLVFRQYGFKYRPEKNKPLPNI